MKAQSSLIIRKGPWHANFTEKNHLGAALIAKPHVFDTKMNQIFTSSLYSDNPLSKLLTDIGSEMTIGKTEWNWQLRGATQRPCVYIGPAATGTPGQYKQEFDFWADTNWAKPGDLLSPGNPSYQIRIQSGPFPVGGKYKYRVRVHTRKESAYIPVKYLKPGKAWNKIGSSYEEGSEQSGSTTYAMPIELQNRMSRFRKSQSVTGDAAAEVLAVKVPDSNGKEHAMWMQYAEAEFWQQWYRELEVGKWYGQPSDVEGSTGRPVFSGPGIQQQILDDGHIHYYNTLSATLIQEFLMDIFYSRITPGASRNVKAFTGEYGMLLFHEAITSFVKGTGFIHQVTSTRDVSSPYNNNAKSGGFQFVRYEGANGVSLDLIHNPVYDDLSINSEIDPITGYPLESMRFTFLDFANGSMGDNVKVMRKDKGYSLAYINGLYGPYGPTNGQAAHAGDYYEVHVKEQMGVHIHDATRCGELIPAAKKLV